MTSNGTTVETRPDGTTAVRTPEGAMTYRFPRRGLFIGRYAGSPSLPLYTHLAPVLERAAATQGALELFVDLSELKDFSPEFREAWAGWFRTHRKQVAALHVLQRSALVSIGLSVINIAIGGILTGYREPDAFERALTLASARGA